MNLRRRSCVLFGGIAVSTLLLVPPAGAASFTIVDGQTVNQTQTLNTTGNVGTVEQGGTIDANNPNGDGISATANGITVDNAGSVTGNGALSNGIRVIDESTITNLGAATGGNNGILVNSDNTITNSGTATGSFIGVRGVNGNNIINSGTATGDNTAGIFVSDANTIVNSGTAMSSTNSGIRLGIGNTVTNSGTATGRFGMTAGIGNTITNTGIVTGSDVGISALNGNTITNSGKIVADYAVSFLGTDNTLTLLRGSNIQGNLALGDSSNTLTVGRGLETALTFTGTPTIDTSGEPFVIADGTLYVVNTTVFSVQDEMTNDLTRAVTGAVEGRLASARLMGGGGMSVAMNGLTITPSADVPMAPDRGIWLSGLGSYREQPRGGDTDAFETALRGAVGGIDGMVADTTRAGILPASRLRVSMKIRARRISTATTISAVFISAMVWARALSTRR